MELRTAVSVEDDALAFLHAMFAVNLAFDSEWILNLLEKPWKWEAEWKLWHEHGKPTDPADESFNVFAEACDRLAVQS